MSEFEKLMTDSVSLVKPNGDRTDNIKARVNSDNIRTFNGSLPIEENDTIERLLPNGNIETYIVLDTGYSSGLPPQVPAHFNIKVRKTTVVTEKAIPTTINHNYNSVQSVQHGDHAIANNTQNITTQEYAELITKMRNVIYSLPEAAQDEARLMTDMLEEQTKLLPVNASRIKALAISTASYLANKGIDLTVAVGGTVLGQVIIQSLHK